MITETKNNKDTYLAWLSDKVSNSKISGLLSAYDVIDEYCMYIKVLKASILETTDLKTIKKVIQAVEQNNVFRFRYKRYINDARTAMHYYYTYVKESVANMVTVPATIPVVQSEECQDTTTPQFENKANASTTDADILFTLENHYNYGINISSPIELLRFKNNFSNDHGRTCSYSDNELVDKIKSLGMEFEGKIYVVSQEALNCIYNAFQSAENQGVLIIYFEEFYNENEDWLYEGHIMSAEMLREIVINAFKSYKSKRNFIVLSNEKYTELAAIDFEISRIWGKSILQTFDALKNKLPYVPLDKIKYTLSYGSKFFWNSFETYAHRDLFVITDLQIEQIKSFVLTECEKNGTVQFDDIPLEEVKSENYELSETALYDILFSFIENDFDKNGKVITRKGEKVDITTTLVQFCKSRESCQMDELENLMSESVGEVRYPIVIEAANFAMVRVDANTFVSDKMVSFDIAAIDSILNTIVYENGIGLKEVTTFNAFPFCGYAWNLYLLESYCRRFSKKYRYACITPNSKNAGAIILKENTCSYHEIMAHAISRTAINISETEVFDYLISAGFMLRRQYTNMNDLLDLATVLRERRG